MKRKLCRRVTAALVAVVMLLLPTQAGAASLSDLQKRLDSLRAEQSVADARRSELEDKIAGARSSVSEQEEKQEQLQEEMDAIGYQISVINSKINLYNQQIHEKTLEMEDTQSKMEETYKLFRERVRAMYLAGEHSTLEILLSAETFSDLLIRSEVIDRITRHDQELVQTLEQYINEIAEDKAAIETAKTEIEGEKATLDQRMAEYNDAFAEVEALRSSLENELEVDEAAHAAMLAEDSAMEAEIQSVINAYQAEQKRQEEARKAAEQAAQQNKKPSGGTTDKTPSSGTVSASGFLWPVPDYHSVSSGFGNRTPSGVVTASHYGIDIPTGRKPMQRIVASKSGTVILSRWSNSYGYYIIIDHGRDAAGNSYQTLYAHNSALYVSVGDYVTQGQVIAGSGETGAAQGIHCHFEVRINGVRVNPLNYVSP